MVNNLKIKFITLSNIIHDPPDGWTGKLHVISLVMIYNLCSYVVNMISFETKVIAYNE